MRASELMIGDLVEVKDYGAKEVIGIIDLDGIIEISEDEYSEVEIPYDDVSPIPLTPEILEKNGWKIDMYSTLDLEDNKWIGYYHHENRLRIWWEVKEIIFQCHCTYVHTLQHALRICGLNELADNFKI